MKMAELLISESDGNLSQDSDDGNVCAAETAILDIRQAFVYLISLTVVPLSHCDVPISYRQMTVIRVSKKNLRSNYVHKIWEFLFCFVFIVDQNYAFVSLDTLTLLS